MHAKLGCTASGIRKSRTLLRLQTGCTLALRDVHSNSIRLLERSEQSGPLAVGFEPCTGGLGQSQHIAMGSVKEESASSAEPVKAEPADMKGDQGIKQPLLPKLPSKSSPHLTSMVPAGPKVANSDLPAFRLAAEGLGGVRLAAVWVM